MEVVFIDPEPPGPAGGGIRTYVKLAMEVCREAGISARAYTHNPAAYAGETALPIGRTPWPPRPLRGLAYRLGYPGVVLWEQARWLERELAASVAEHSAPAPLVVREEAAGLTEWYRGAYAALRERAQALARDEGYALHAPLQAWVAQTLTARADKLFSWAERVLDALPYVPPGEHLGAEAANIARNLRNAIDAYKAAVDSGRVMSDVGASGYPPSLEILVAGVEDARNPDGAKIYFLRRLPRDPFFPDPAAQPASTWGLRSYESSAQDPRPGDDVFDIHSLSPGVGINGVPYREW